MNRQRKGSRFGAAVDAAVDKLDTAQGVAGGALGFLAAESKVAFNDKLLDKVFPECPVPAFMLPTGPSADDYRLLFRLDEMLENLESGILVRPKIQVWAARKSGFDLQRFGEELKVSFLSQFNDARDRLIDKGLVKIDNLELKRERLSDEIRAEASGPTLKSATRWTAAGIVGLPVLVLFLALGFRPRTKLIGLLRDYFRLRGDKKQAEQQLAREVGELESRFDKKDKAFQRAVTKIEVRVHPRIRNLAVSVCDAAGVAFSDDGSEPESGDIPDLEPYLRDPRYREQVPYRYQWLLTVKPSK